MNTTKSPRILVPLLIAAVALILRFVPGWVAPMTMLHFMGLGLGPLIGLLGLLLWWLFARGVSWRDRLLGSGAGVLVIVLTIVISDRSIVPVLMMRGLVIAIALVAGALLVTRSMSWSTRRWIFAAALALGLLPWAAFRVEGQTGGLVFEVAPRWTPTAESTFLDQRAADATAADGGAAVEAGALVGVEADWPGFRGADRDGVLHGVTFSTDWESTPPKELWRHRIGPGWSSFAVAGGLIFTQEQRGEDEVVVAYSLAAGDERWVHASRERFEEPQGGPGPRATPSYDDGQLFTFGASGTVTALDAATGNELWTHNVVEDLDAPIPDWGFSGSPLVIGESVIVHAGASDDRGLVAYHRETGEIRWTAGRGRLSYSSPIPAELGGVSQVLIATDLGLEAFAPDDGASLWVHEWPVPQMPRIVGPLILADGSVLFPTGYNKGTQRIELTPDGDRFSTRTLWESRSLKPYFSDAVCHEEHCYGFDNRIFASIAIADGARAWKGGRYGNGQVALLPDMDALLIVSEEGELVLVAADPAGHRELARMQVFDGKTWDHPVIVGDKLLVRNDEEAACYTLPGVATVEARVR